MTVLEVESQNLKATELSIDAVETQHHEDTIKCDEERAKALEDLAQYTAELDELTQIAKPSVRYQHVVTVEGMPEAPNKTAPALLEAGTWTTKSCEAFVAYAKRHMKMHLLSEEKPEGPRQRPRSAKPIELNCNQQRNKLQRIFSKAYNAVKDLQKDAKDRSEDDTCQETADAKKASLLVPLVAQREEATGKIEYSEAAIAALEPVLKLVQNRVDKLQDHIDRQLAPECREASEVSKYLQNVRELIISLEKCPGKDDFILKIPAEEKDGKCRMNYREWRCRASADQCEQARLAKEAECASTQSVHTCNLGLSGCEWAH
jgi:cation transport regulator ChaB